MGIVGNQTNPQSLESKPSSSERESSLWKKEEGETERMRWRHSTHVSLNEESHPPTAASSARPGSGGVGPAPDQLGLPSCRRWGRETQALGTGEQTPCVSGRALCPPPAHGQGSWDSGRSVHSTASEGRKPDATCYAILTVIDGHRVQRDTPPRHLLRPGHPRI